MRCVEAELTRPELLTQLQELKSCRPYKPSMLRQRPREAGERLETLSYSGNLKNYACHSPCHVTEHVTMLVGFCLAASIYSALQLLFLWLNTWKASSRQRCKPSAVLLLGGNAEREQLAAELIAGLHLRACAGARDPELLRQAARSLNAAGVLGVLTDRDVPVYASSPATDVPAACRAAGGVAAASERIAVDTQAVDTVSNFTTLAPLLYGTLDEHVLVLTSGWHAERAAHVATVVLRDACGIAFTIVGLPCSAEVPSENLLKCLRDELRALLWLTTGALVLLTQFVQKTTRCDRRQQPRRCVRQALTAAAWAASCTPSVSGTPSSEHFRPDSANRGQFLHQASFARSCKAFRWTAWGQTHG